jgi:hypothetical protein
VTQVDERVVKFTSLCGMRKNNPYLDGKLPTKAYAELRSGLGVAKGTFLLAEVSIAALLLPASQSSYIMYAS